MIQPWGGSRNSEVGLTGGEEELEKAAQWE